MSRGLRSRRGARIRRTLAIAACAAAHASAAAAAPRVWIADEGLRVPRDRTGSPASRGEGNPLWHLGRDVKLDALRGEVVGFQVVVESDDAQLDGVTVELAAFSGTQADVPVATRFVEHYVQVRARSRNDRRPLESL